MTQLRPRLVRNALTSKGFRLSEGDHARYVFYFEGRKTDIRTMLSNNSRDIGDELIHRMAVQTRLSKSDFVNLVSCTLSENEYVQKLKAAGVDLNPAT